MRQIRDFECNVCGNRQERYIDDSVREYPCECGGRMERIIGLPTVYLDGTDPGFPGAYDKWARDREKRHIQQAKKNR